MNDTKPPAYLDTKLDDEEGRLAALRRYEILDTPQEAPFDRITGLVQAVLQVPISTVSLIDADRQWYKSCVGMDSADLPREFSFCTHTIQAREPFLIPDTLRDPRFAHYPTVVGKPFIRSYAGIPLASPDGYNLGSLCALDIKPRDFTPVQVEVMKSFAALVVDELELRRIAQIDCLTGAATRRSFLLEMEKSISKFIRSGTNATLLSLDIDHFKRVNDQLGHPFGDTVLRAISCALSGMLRTEDLLGRIGGEEFGILLGETTLDQAVIISERLREAVANLTFMGEPALRVTASFGIASVNQDILTPDDWLASTDPPLYEAKRSGRNRCCVAHQLEPVA